MLWNPPITLLVKTVEKNRLFSLNSPFYRERILITGSQYLNKYSQDFRYY